MLTCDQDVPESGETPGKVVTRSPRTALATLHRDPREQWPEHASTLYDYLTAIYGEDDPVCTVPAGWIASRSRSTRC